MLGRLLVHASNYTWGSLLVTLAGFISFPIFTRLFSVDEYGLMSLVSATLMLLTGVAKLGLQHSIVRFHAELRAGKRALSERAYYSTVLLGMGGIGAGVALAWSVVSQFVPAHWWGDPRVPPLLLLTSGLVFVRVIDSALVNILRAQQRSAVFSTYNVARKYVGLAIILGTVFYVLPGLSGFYVGTIVAEVLAVTVLLALLLRRQPIAPAEFSPVLLRSMLVFGVPMIAYELGGLVLSVGDRYVIQNMLGPAALGAYAAAYNLCEYVQMIVVASFGQALIPMYTRLWEEKGEHETRRFIEQALHYYIVLAAAVIAGLAAIGTDVLTLLASEKFSAGAVVIPWVIAGMVVDGSLPIFGAGLFIHKQTRVIMGLVLASAAFNIALNVALIPSLHIVGAAIATLASYFFLAACVMVLGTRRLPVSMPWLHLAKCALLAVAMYAVVANIDAGHGLPGLLVRIAAGAATYAVLVLTFDRRARGAVGAIGARLGLGAHV